MDCIKTVIFLKDYITNNVIDAAVLWEKNSYVKGTMMCISFQFQKHLSLGRGGMILLDDKDWYPKEQINTTPIIEPRAIRP